MGKILALLVVLVVLGGAALLYQQVLASGSSRAPQPVARAAPAQTPAAPAALPPQVKQIELSEADLTQLLRTGLTSAGYDAGDLVVHLEDGRFVATTSQQVGFLRVPVKIVGEASMVEGQLSVRPVSVTAGGVSVPQTTIDEIAASMNAQFSSAIANLPLRPTSIEIKPGRLIIQGVAK